MEEEQQKNVKSLAELNRLIDDMFNDLQHKVLDYVECAVEKDRFKAVRSKVLGACNKTKREFREELKRNWIVKYTHVPPATGKDVVVVGNLVQDKRNGTYERKHIKNN